MSLVPQTQRDQVKFLIGFVAVALAAAYYVYPYGSREEQMEIDLARVAQLDEANQRAARDVASGSLESLRIQAAENRSALLVMRRLVPTGNEVPALLEEVSTAARRAGLDVGGVIPEPVIPGERFDTYRYTVTMMGGYHQFGEFLANVGSLARIVAPVSFSVTTSAGNAAPRSVPQSSEKGGLASTITLQTYVDKTSPAKPAVKERSS
jgi:type IV pilus assembly protein PilO